MLQRVVVFRSGAIGDIMHILPSLRLFKTLNPSFSIELVQASAQVQELLEAYAPYINKVWLSKANNIASNSALIDSFSKTKVDLFVYLHSNFLRAWIWNFLYVQAKTINTYMKNTRYHAVENFALNFPGLSVKELETKTLILRGVEPNPKLISLVPGVGSLRPHRAYPLSYVLELIEKLLAGGFQVQVLGGPDEQSISQLISDKFPQINNLIGKTSLKELANQLSLSTTVISADTGILHIASALGLKTISIFGITSEHRTGAYSSTTQVLRSTNCICTSMNKNCGNEQKSCLQPYRDNFGEYSGCLADIKPEMVIDELFKQASLC